MLQYFLWGKINLDTKTWQRCIYEKGKLEATFSHEYEYSNFKQILAKYT